MPERSADGRARRSFFPADPVFAHTFLAAFLARRVDRRSAWPTTSTNLAARFGLYGSGPHRRDALQSPRRLVARSAQPTDRVASSAFAQIGCVHPPADRLGAFLVCSSGHQSSHLLAVAAHARHGVLLFSDEAVHRRDAFFPWPRARDRPDRRLDRSTC